MIASLIAPFRRPLGGQVANLAMKISLFVFLVATMVWLGTNIMRVSGGHALTAASVLHSVAPPASAAATSSSGHVPSSDTPTTTPGRHGESRKMSEVTGKDSPVSDQSRAPSFEQLTALAAMCGALGATLHALGSLVAFVGNGKFVPSWSLWYLAQPIRGAALACGVYWASYGDFLSPSAVPETGAGALGLMFMVGLFSDRALEKLREVFLVLFHTGAGPRSDPLGPTRKPVIAKARIVAPAGGAARVEVDGEGFELGDEVTINGNKQKILSLTTRTLSIEVPAQMVVQGSKLEVVVRPTETGAVASVPSLVTVP